MKKLSEMSEADSGAHLENQVGINMIILKGTVISR